jgi:nitroreductase
VPDRSAESTSPAVDRRRFIRLAGGGAVSVALAPLAGCSSEYPAAAVAPWAGPGNEPDLRRWALGYAILAPNSHNRQPWLVDLREPDAITLYVDRTRLLPETDPWFRQIVVSQGTFLESLLLALKERGVNPRLTLFPQGEFAPRALDDRPVARVHWQAGEAASAKDPLFAQLLRRHTAKVPYDTNRPVAASALAQLQAALAPAGAASPVRFGGTVEPARRDALRELSWQAAQVELGTPRTMMESIRLIRLGPDEIAQHRDGISVNGWMPRLAAMVGAFDRSQPPAPGSTAAKQSAERFQSHNATAMGWVWLSTPVVAGATRAAEVEAGRAYMRLQLQATAMGLQMHPMSQAPQEFAEMKPHHERLHALLLGKPATEEVVQMLCRVGYCAEQAHTPRRGVDAIIRA